MKQWMVLVGVATLAVVAVGEDEQPAAERLLVGGVVHTQKGPQQVTVAIRDGRIVGLVPRSDATAWRDARTMVFNMRGAHVFPGLADAHLHLAGYGAALEQVDLNGAASWDEVVERARTAAGRLPAGAWLLGRGWDQNLWPDKAFPDRAALDLALADRPVLLRRVDGHAAVANGRALQLAGIDAATPDPEGGKVLRRADGEPSGVLIDNAISLVRAAVPEVSPRDLERHILRSASALARLGLTAVHDAGTTAAELEVLRKLERDDRLPIRVYVMLDGTDEALLAAEFARGPQLTEGAMLRVGCVKLYADGALGSRGALLGADYADDAGNRGLAVNSVEHLRKVTRRATKAGFQVAVHAIGDEGVHRVLDVFASVPRDQRQRLRHRVEHSQTVRPDDVGRFAAYEVVASVQPTHCTSDMPWAPERLGRDRVAWAYRWRSFLDAGVRLAGGSDAPVESPDPMRGLFAARTRQQPDGQPRGGWNPAERLTGAEAVDLFTSGAAWAARADGWSGAIRIGFAADLTVVDTDLATCPPEQLLRTNVVRTVVNGSDRYVDSSALGYGGRS
jgi:predicted amidohydrolase YtcJ